MNHLALNFAELPASPRAL